MISLQQRSYHQGWSVHLYGIDNGRWFAVIERPAGLGATTRWSGTGATTEEAVAAAWERTKAGTAAG